MTPTPSDMETTAATIEPTPEATNPAVEEPHETETKQRTRTPRTRSKALAASARAEATPEATTAALERIYADSRTRTITGLQRNIEQLDQRLRDTDMRRTKPREWSEQPAWLRRTGKLVRARAGAAFRIRWFEARRESGGPLPFVEPTNSDLIREFTAGARFSSLDRLGLMSVASWDVGGMCEARNATQTALNLMRWKTSQVVDRAFSGLVTATAFPGWSQVEARASLLLKREAELAARLDRFIKLSRPFAAACKIRVEALRQEITDAALGRAWFQICDPGRVYPPTENSEIIQAKKTLAEIESAVGKTIPAGPNRDQILSAMRAPHQALIEKNLEWLRVAHETAVAGYQAHYSNEALYLCTSPQGWRKIGEVADRNPRHFPTGFADRWLACVTDAMLEVGPDVFVELLDAA